MIRVGQKIKFDPFVGVNNYGIEVRHRTVEGKVITVYPKHRYFTAKYKMGDKDFLISFNFNDVYGEKPTVRLVH